MKTLVCLLIDDDAEEAEIFHYALEEFSSSVKCVSASSGKEAIAYLTKHPGVVDYIFLDMNMPRMSGLECLTQLKKMGLSASVPIVLYSGTFLEEQENMLTELGASAFLTKTGSVFDLQNELFRLFESPNLKKLTTAQKAVS